MNNVMIVYTMKITTMKQINIVLVVLVMRRYEIL